MSALWGVAIPAAFLCGWVLKLDILFVYLAMSLEQIVKCGFGIGRLRSGRWIRDITRSEESATCA